MIFILIISSLLSWFPPATVASTTDHSIVSSHQWWDQWLKKYVSESGAVNYKGMKAEAALLKRYIGQLGMNAPTDAAAKSEQMAYWINLYNAATIDLILNNYPVKSIRDISNGKPWDDAFISSGGKKYSLNQIENDILRKKYDDPRIHFAINCAAKSCPKLMNGAFTADKLESQLNTMTKAFVNDPYKNKITAQHVDISEIFNWYKEDFTKSGNVIDFINAYSAMRISANATIHYLNYDWSLNDQL